MGVPMFSADLSWSDQCAETVGQRRERRLRGREGGSSTQSFQSDESTSKSSFWSLPSRRKNNTPKSHQSASRKGSKLSLHDRQQSTPKDPVQDAEWSMPAELPPSQLTSQLPVLPALPSIASSESTAQEPNWQEPVWQEPRSPRGQTRRSSGSTNSPHFSLNSRSYALDNDTASSAYHTPPDAGPKCTWEAPSDWDIASIRSYSMSNNRQSFESSFLCDPDAAELSQFQRFIRRMESAGPKVILDRLKDEPSPDVLAQDPYAEDEIAVEKHLWVLTALQLQNMENSLVPNQGVGPLLGLPTLFRQPKRVLELYSNLAKIKPILRDLLRMLAPGGILELRLIDGTPVRATMGPRLRAWFEERLLLNLEKEFLCSRPLALLPGWVKECGFRVLEGGDREKDLVVQRLRLPACAHPKESVSRHTSLHSLRRKSRQENIKRSTLDYNRRNGMIGSNTKCTDFAALFEDPAEEAASGEGPALHGELAALVARGLWKDSWGSLVDKGPTVGRDMIWWWDDPEIVRECWDYGTVFECGTMFAFKE
ncbi:hypothetical protein UCRNP2_8543 [Neofusicoccum parvum UCRNP2]|uniref:Uncharacterized protein n=1 Tax=Botryosphaeria parva (strain UCR-NP2) TaxID=1287680 RepID=R1EAC4_BOTPV|nr:hypothetical protein UCRNP2_8543 [Neofusicoccum parvum UCRNP2]